MKKIALILFLIFGVMFAAQAQEEIDISVKPGPDGTVDFKFPEYTVKTLSNGLKVFIIEDNEQPTIAFRLLIPGGSSMDGDMPGLADFTATLLTKGAAEMNAFDMAKKLDGVGASVSASASGDYIKINASSLKKHLPLLLDIFSKVILNPTFPDDEFDKLVPQMKASIKQQKTNPSGVAFKLAKVALYGSNHPYAKNPTETSVDEIDIDDVEDYYKKYFIPNNSTLAVVGDIEEEEIIRLLEKALEDWKKGEIPGISLPEPEPQPAGVYYIERPSSVQSAVIIATQGIARKHKDYEAYQTAGNIMGASFAGRLFRIVREKHSYTYSPSGGVTSNKYMNIFFANAEVRNSVTDSTIVVIKELMSDLVRKPPMPDELNRVKNYVVGSYMMNFESSSFIAGLVQNANFYDLKDERVKNYYKTIQSMSPTRVSTAAAKYMDPSLAYIIVVGSNEVLENLKQFGKVFIYNYDLEPISGEKAKFESVSYDAEELIEKYTEAIGGKEAISKINTIIDTTKMQLTIQGKNIEGLALQYSKAPNKKYSNVDIKIQKLEIWVDGKSAWLKSAGAVQEQKDENLQKYLTDAILFLEVKLLNLGYNCEVLGSQGENIIMKAVSPDNQKRLYYFDAETFLITKLEKHKQTKQGPMVETQEFSNYVEIEGIKLPGTIKMSNPYLFIESNSKYTINEQLDDAFFKPELPKK